MENNCRCKRCVMDNSSDNTISFDSKGYCNYCTSALKRKEHIYMPNAVGEANLRKMISMLKKEGEGKEYDCIMGISGGLDSAYLAYLGYKWGLRILAVHIDDGYDTEISKANIRKLCKAAHIELKTIMPDEVQYNDLIKAYIKAGVPGLAIPQDNILLAFLYDVAAQNNLKYFLSGGNFALECILQKSGHTASDIVNIKDINRRYGTEKTDKLKFISFYKRLLFSKAGKVIELRPLNYIEYNRDKAFFELKQFCEFEYYGRKHLENIFTAFLQLYWLPKKFGIDKRTSHLSSMIISGQMTRDEAMKELAEPLYDEKLMDEYISIIKEKMKITDVEFEQIMQAPTHQHTEFRTDKLGQFLRKIPDSFMRKFIRK